MNQGTQMAWKQLTWKQRLLWVPPVKKQRHWSVAEKVASAVLWLLATVILSAGLPYRRWSTAVVLAGTFFIVSAAMVVVHDRRTRREARRPSPGGTTVAG